MHKIHKHTILLINGPNLNLLGNREAKIYGTTSLKTIVKKTKKISKKFKVNLLDFQSNSESKIIEKIHYAKNTVDYMIINPAAFTHTSIAIRDALLAINIPFIEVHITNIHAREDFRRNSWISDISSGVITGFGIYGYIWALKTIVKRLRCKNN